MKKLLFLFAAFIAATTGFADNLALGKATKATSGDATAALAVDGNNGTRWESAFEDPQTWQVDLGEAQEFTKIKIVWEGAYASDFTIEAGDEVDADGWLTGGTTIVSIADQSLSDLTVTYELENPVTARYIKFNGTKRATGWGYSFWEFQVLTPSVYPAVPAPTGDAIQSIYSTQIGSAPDFNFYDWGGGKGSAEDINGTEAYKISEFAYFGSQFQKTDVSNKKFLHFDIYPLEDMTLGFVMINRNATDTGNDGEKGIQKNLTGGQWNSIDIPVQDYLDKGAAMSRLYQMKYVSKVAAESAADVAANDGFENGDKSKTFIIGNVYFYGTREIDEEAPVITKAEVTAIEGTDVTFALAATDNSNKVSFTINDGTKDYTVDAVAGEETSYTIRDLQPNTDYTFTVTAKDAAGNLSDATTVQATTGDGFVLTAAPVPTKAQDDVLSVYSNAYTAATTFDFGDWGQSTAVATETVDGDDMLKLTSYNYLGFELGSELDISDMDYIHIDILPMQEMNVGITPIMRGGITEKSTSVGELQVKKWNSIDLPLADFGFDLSYKMFQMKIDRGTGVETVYVDNIYFWKDGGDTPDPQPTELIDNGADANGMHKLTGPWSDEAFATIDAAAKANSYDLTDVSHEGTINVINKTANPYCLFVTSTPGTVNRNELVAEGEGYHGYALYFQENWNDGKTYDINTSLSPISVDNPFFQRLFDRAGYYVTITVPFDYNSIPDAAAGTKFYEIAASTDNKSITFREVTAIEKNKPYLAYVATGGITIPDPGAVTIDFNAATEQSGSMSFMANYKQQTLNTGYVLPLGALAADGLTFSKADGATLRPFRAYIANASAGARISVLFDEATGLRSATAEELGKLFNVYSIDGRVVRQQTNSAANLPAGIYVINGKKAVVK